MCSARSRVTSAAFSAARAASTSSTAVPGESYGPGRPSPDGHEQSSAPQPGREIVRVVRSPRRGALARVPPEGVRVAALPADQLPVPLRPGAGLSGVDDPAERGRGAEEAGVPRRIAERAEPTHGQAADRADGSRPVALLENPSQLDQVEGLPLVAGDPVRVEADPAAFRQHHEQVAARGELDHVGGAGPATVRVTAAVQQVEHRPLPAPPQGRHGCQRAAGTAARGVPVVSGADSRVAISEPP
jgi:hypothetical protein